MDELYFEIYQLDEEARNKLYALGTEVYHRLVTSGMTSDQARDAVQELFSVGREEGYVHGHERGYDRAYCLYADCTDDRF